MHEFSASLAGAAVDYRYLLDRSYPEKAAVELVGNRFGLSREERLILYRGLCSEAAARRRRATLCRPIPGEVVILDTYNAAFSLLHYLTGRPCFLCADGFMRDAGAAHGRVQDQKTMTRALGELALFLGGMDLSVDAVFDAPVPHSGEHAALFAERMAAAGRSCFSHTEKCADGWIRSRLGSMSGAAVVASADSALAEACPRMWDIAKEIVESRFGATLPDLNALLKP